MDYSKKEAIHLIQKIKAGNQARRLRMHQLDAARVAEIAEWGVSDTFRSQIPNLRGTPLSRKSPRPIASSPRTAAEREEHTRAMRVSMKQRDDERAALEKAAVSTPQDLALRVQTQHKRQDYQDEASSATTMTTTTTTTTTTNNNNNNNNGISTVLPTSTLSSLTAPTTTSLNISRSVMKSPRRRHVRVASQQWQSPGHVRQIHSTMETIVAVSEEENMTAPALLLSAMNQAMLSSSERPDDSLMTQADSSSSSSSSPSSSPSLSPKKYVVNHNLLARTIAFAQKQKEHERIRKEQEEKDEAARKEAEMVEISPKMFSKMRQFLDKKREAAHRDVLGLLSLWLPPSYEIPLDAAVSSIASTKAKADFEAAAGSSGNDSTPPFYSIIRMDNLNHENSLDELLHRGGKFHCPKNMSMVFPVGPMDAMEDNTKVTLLVCRVRPGVSFWMDEHDMPGLSRDAGHVFLPTGPPDDFDSICLLGRRTSRDKRTGRRRSSLDGVGDPIDPMNEYYRYLIQHPNDQAIAMWCVTFTPTRRGSNNSSGSGRGGRNEDNGGRGASFKSEEKETMTLKTPPIVVGSKRWEQRSQRKKILSTTSPEKKGRRGSFDMAAVVQTAVQQEKDRVSSWENLEEVEKVDEELEKFEVTCGESVIALQEKLMRLHKQLEEVHTNYMNVQNDIHDDLRNSLTDVQMEKTTRKNALQAWQLQLAQSHMTRVQHHSLEQIAKEELTSDQLEVYHEYFDEVSTRHSNEAHPPGWMPEKPPVDRSIANIQLSGGSTNLVENIVKPGGVGGKKMSGGGRAVVGGNDGRNNADNVEQKNFEYPSQKLRIQPRSNDAAAAAANNASEQEKVKDGPSIRVGGKKVKGRRSSVVDMMDALKQVGLDSSSRKNTRNRKSAEVKQAAELAEEDDAFSNDMLKKFTIAAIDDNDELSIELKDTAETKGRSAPIRSSPLKQQLHVLEVNDLDGNRAPLMPLPPATPDGSPVAQNKRPPRNLGQMIFQPSSPRVKHHNKNMSLGGQQTSSVPKIKSGWIYKRGQMNKAKKKRWFELTPNQLIYRESQIHTSKRGHMQVSVGLLPHLFYMFFSRIVVCCLVPSFPFLIILLPCVFHVLLFFLFLFLLFSSFLSSKNVLCILHQIHLLIFSWLVQSELYIFLQQQRMIVYSGCPLYHITFVCHDSTPGVPIFLRYITTQNSTLH